MPSIVPALVFGLIAAFLSAVVAVISGAGWLGVLAAYSGGGSVGILASAFLFAVLAERRAAG